MNVTNARNTLFMDKGIGRYEIQLEKVLLMVILNQKNEKQKQKIKTQKNHASISSIELFD